MPQDIQQKLIEQKMQESYIDYAMSVITARAIPDVRDGLKPVHRRVLFSMYDMGLQHNKSFAKSARIVGDCFKYHPHGDASIYDTLVRMAQNFSLRYPLVHGHGNFGCFTKDTKVLLTDGRSLSFTDLIIEHKQGKKNYTYTINKLGNIAISEIQSPRLTIKHAEIMSIILDNGEEVRCTLNHLFMLRDGTYRKASQLKEDDSLMPCYTKLSENIDRLQREGYLLFYQPKTNIWTPAHHLADNYNLTNHAYTKEMGRIRHHLDFNKLNNNPENIRRVHYAEHWKIHYEHASELHKNPDYREKVALGRKKYWDNKDVRKAYSERLSKRNISNWNNPEYRGKMQESLSVTNKEHIEKHPEKRQEFSKRATTTLKRLWSTKDYRDKKVKALKKKWEDPSYRYTQSERMRDLSKRIWANSEHRDFISTNSKKWSALYENARVKAYKDRWDSDKKFRDYFLPILRENAKRSSYYLFLAVCKKVISEHRDLNLETYEEARKKYNTRKGAGIINYQNGLKKFFDDDITKLYATLGIETPIISNHKIKKITFLRQYEDVYDLTIKDTNNFALAAGIFVHNSVDGDPAGAMRYTEAKLAKISDELLFDLDKETVDFMPNFDTTLKEPIVFPARLPNLLINGSSGIAVGMATNIPPHNIVEVIDAVVYFIDHRDADVKELMRYLKGPDFPTGACIYGLGGIYDAYSTGRGKVIVRGKATVEDSRIVITEIPYMVNKSLLLENIADLVRDDVLEGISDIRDESDRQGMRIVIELKKSADGQLVLGQLYKHTSLQSTFGIIMLALHDGRPLVLTLRDLLTHYLNHRISVVTRRIQFELDKAEKRAHIIVGLQVALEHIDALVQLLKQAQTVDDARTQIMATHQLTEIQANAILDMKLQRLTSLETTKLHEEHKELTEKIAEYQTILSSQDKILGIIKQELSDIKEAYKDPRRTEIFESDVLSSPTEEDLVQAEDVVITLTHSGYIKQLPLSTYHQQKRGGQGVIGAETKDDDLVKDVFITSNRNTLLVFTNKGKVHWLKAYQIPEGSRYSRGKAIVNLLSLDEGEHVTTVLPVATFDYVTMVFMATKKGIVKKTELTKYSNPRKGGIIAITLDQGDELVGVALTSGSSEMFLSTKKGNAVRFSEKDVRTMGRTAAGVRGVSLEQDDAVVSLGLIDPGATLFTITEKGYGKRTPLEDYRLIHRGGSGVINIKTDERNGLVIATASVRDTDDLLIMSQKGNVVRVSAKDISVIGRNTSGVRVMKLKEGDTVKSIAKISGTALNTA